MVNRVAYVLERRMAGFRPSEIAEEIGKPIKYAESVIDNYRKNKGWSFPALGPAGSLLDNYVEYIKTCAYSGLTWVEIAFNIGCEYGTVRDFCQRMDIAVISANDIRTSGYPIDRPMNDIKSIVYKIEGMTLYQTITYFKKPIEEDK